MNFQHIIYKTVVVITLLMLSLGCTSGELDFDQVNDFETKPIYKVYISDFIPTKDVKIPSIIILGGDSKTFTESINNLFENPLFKNTITKAELNFLIINKINSQFTIEIQLIDKNGNEIDKFNITVPTYSRVDFVQNFVRTYDTQNQIASLKNIGTVNVTIKCNDMAASTSESIKMSTLLTAYIEP